MNWDTIEYVSDEVNTDKYAPEPTPWYHLRMHFRQPGDIQFLNKYFWGGDFRTLGAALTYKDQYIDSIDDWSVRLCAPLHVAKVASGKGNAS